MPPSALLQLGLLTGSSPEKRGDGSEGARPPLLYCSKTLKHTDGEARGGILSSEWLPDPQQTSSFAILTRFSIHINGQNLSTKPTAR